jgi:hypothetical protein
VPARNHIWLNTMGGHSRIAIAQTPDAADNRSNYVLFQKKVFVKLLEVGARA